MQKTDLQKDRERQYGILRYIDYDVLIDFCAKELNDKQMSRIADMRMVIKL